MTLKYPNTTISHQPVEKSSSIKTVGYDPDSKELHVDFHGSGMYVYHDVHHQTYKGLMAAESRGKFLHKHIKPHHEHKKYGGEDGR